MVVKSAFAHKVKNGGENYKKNVRKKLTGRASKEVVVKISGGAVTRQGIKIALII